MDFILISKGLKRSLSLGVLMVAGFCLAACGGGSTGENSSSSSSSSSGGEVSDTVPDAFSFTAVNGIELNVWIESNPVTITGINSSATISISGGEYSIGAGDFTSESGTVSNNQNVKLRVLSSTEFNTPASVTLVVGGVDAAFSVTTVLDTVPDSFSFTDTEDVLPNIWIESNTVTMIGFDAPTSISVSGGEYSIDDGDFTNASSTISNNQNVKLRVLSSAEFNTPRSATLTVGGLDADFEVTTVLIDAVPDAFTFVDQADVLPGSEITSAPILVSGINTAATISIDSGSYSLDGGQNFTSADGVVNASDNVIVRVTSSSIVSDVVGVMLTIGGISDVFEVATVSNDFKPSWSNASELPSLHTLSRAEWAATSVSSADLDGDGDLDVLSTSAGNDSIVWYENDGAVESNFTKHVITTSEDGARSVLAADIDGDGDLDVLSASSNDPTLAWYENDGAVLPSFTKQVITTSQHYVSSVFAIDLDSDGDTDVLLASYNNDTIAWYENDGAEDPSFNRQIVSSTVEGAISVFAGDVDGDGDVDLLSASKNDDTIAWYENDGAIAPNFTKQEITTLADGASSVFATDMDGDGDLDVVSASSFSDTIEWYENDGAVEPSFTTRVIATTVAGANSVFAADVDGDGDVDVLSASRWDDTIALYENDGVGVSSFTKQVITTSADYAHSVIAADLNGDGNLEVLSASYDDDTIAWYGTTQRSYVIAENQTLTVTESATDADGNLLTYTVSHGADADFFTMDSSTGELTFANAPLSSAPLDADGDNIYQVWISVSDSFSVINRSVEVRVYIDDTDDDNDGTPDVDDAFPLDASEWMDTDLDGIGNNTDTDDDNDGVLDVDDPSPLDASNTVVPTWFNASDTPILNTLSLTADGATSVYSADVDGDGDLDVLSASYNDDTIAWYENDGESEPTFIEHNITTTADNARSVFAADVDGDGDLDVLSASISDDTIAWYENDGAVLPGFTKQVITLSADSAVSVFTADVDDDGDLDVLSASVIDHTIAWYENDGAVDPSFAKQVITSSALYAVSVFVADVDDDGDLDVLSASRNSLTWYENDGAVDPSFTERPITDSAAGSTSIISIDMDGDGDMDVLSAAAEDNSIAWYENDGAGIPGFTKHRITTSTDTTFSVFAKDIDGDGDLDILSASYTNDAVAWYENDGQGDPSYTEHIITTSADGAKSVLAVDINDDGIQEVLSASSDDSTIAWFDITQRSYGIAENETLTVTEAATDADGNLLTYAVSHGADAAFFTIDDLSGELTFTNAPLTSAPQDADGDNIYKVWISVSDGFSTLNRSISVTVVVP